MEKFNIYPYKNDATPDKMANMKIDRDLASYLSIFHYNIGDLRGKKILDVGSGAGVFAVEAKKDGLDVVAMDPAYKYDTGADWIKRTVVSKSTVGEKIKGLFKGHNINFPSVVCADSKSCPFVDESFDLIFNLCGAYFYCTSPEDLRSIFWEQLRILKKGGEISIFPMEEYKKYIGYNNSPIEIDGKKIMLGISSLNIDSDNRDLRSAVMDEFGVVLKEIINNHNFNISIFENRKDEKSSFALRIKK